MQKTNECLQILNFISNFADVMAGLYIHIPFCKSRCIYCGFYSTTAIAMRQHYVDAVCKECSMRRQELAQPVTTIYIGGGTPSQLTARQLQQLFSHVAQQCSHSASQEITIEVNPDDVDEAFAEALAELPVNRVSMGAQTFDNQRLRFLHRRHTAEQVPQAVRLLRQAGIRNISVDLMYGFPGETIDDWLRDIGQALSLHVEHLSAYCLMIEEGTALYHQMRNDNEEMGNEELERQMYEVLTDRLAAAGYEHYEISNFARPGYRSRHNSSYWQDVPYIGLGAAAHSYDGKCRSWNVADIRQYIEAIGRGERPFEQETIDDNTHYNDRIATALRTSDGLLLTTLADRHRRYCLREAQPFLADGLLRLTDDNRLILTRSGLFVSDMIMSALMWV